MNVYGSNPKKVKLDHYVFDYMSGWNIKNLPTLEPNVTDAESVYITIHHTASQYKQKLVNCS